MDLDTLEKREQELKTWQGQQMQRLENAKFEMKAASDSLMKIQGALEDCDFWKGEIRKQSQANRIAEALNAVNNGEKVVGPIEFMEPPAV